MRPALLLAALLALTSGCASPSWRGAVADAEARLVDSAGPAAQLALAELALVVDGDLERAVPLVAEAARRAAPGSPLADRAALAAVHLAFVRDDYRGLVDVVAPALANTRDPVLAELLAASVRPLWARPPGPAVPPELVAALAAVSSRQGADWQHARAEAANQRIMARRLGEGSQTGAEASREAGIITDWRLSAPWGQVPERDFHRDHGPEGRALAAAELTGAGWNQRKRATWEGSFSDGEVTFFDIDPDGGLGFAQAAVESREPTLAALMLETNRSAVVFANGVEVLRIDRFAAPAPWAVSATAVLPAGATRLVVRFATGDGKGFFRLAAVDAKRGTPLAASAEPVGDAGLGAVVDVTPSVPAIGRLAVDIETGDAAAAIRSMVATQLALRRPWRDLGLARRLLADADLSVAGYPGLALLRERLAAQEPTIAAKTRRNARRAELLGVLDQWPANLRALRGLGRVERSDDRLDRALAYWHQALDARPGDALTLLDLLGHHQARGWEAEALDIAEQLAGSIAASPRIGQDLVDLHQRFGYIEQAQAAARQLQAAFPGAATTRLADLAGDAGRYAEQARLLQQRFAAHPQNHAALRAAVKALRAAGELSQARQLVAGFLQRRPEDGWALSERARIALQAGDRAAFDAAVDEVIALYPDFAPVESLAAWIAGRAEVLDAVDDGADVVAAFRRRVAEGTGADWAGFPIVNLLDRSVQMVRSDGSTLELSHRVRLVQTRSGADSLGDFRPPSGARLLTVRTLKADGRVLWPERTPGKPDLSFRGLSPGDAVETAWVTRERVRPQEGGYLGGITFASWNIPTVDKRAELIVAPDLEAHWRGVNGAPAPAVTTQADGTTVLSWRAADLPPVPREPLSASARTFFPFVDLNIGRSVDARKPWSDIASMYAGRIARLTRIGARTRKLADELADGATSDRQRAWRAFLWVKEELTETERFNTFESGVEAAIASNKGNRALVLTALGRALGLNATLLICAPRRDGRPADAGRPVPNANRFFYPVVKFTTDSGWYLADPARPYSPFNTLPAEVYGGRCLDPGKSDTGAPFAVLPSKDSYRGEPMRWAFELDLTLDASGEARGTLAASAFGPATSGLRHAFLNVDRARQRIIWEQWAATLLPGARVVDSRVERAATADKPMRWTLTLEIPGYASLDNGRLVTGQLIKPLLGADLASVPGLERLVALQQRKTPLRLVPHAETVTIRLRPPLGTEFVRSADTEGQVDLRRPGMTLTQKALQTGADLVIQRSVELVPGRVEPADYPAFRTGLNAAIRTFERGVATTPLP